MKNNVILNNSFIFHKRAFYLWFYHFLFVIHFSYSMCQNLNTHLGMIKV